MKVLIVEDEARIARRVERMTRAFFGPQLQQLTLCESLAQAAHTLATDTPDLLLLDLNLNNQDGFQLLASVAAGAFHTIIISAHTDRAITAFGYGVLDFVPKPFAEDRLHQALQRLGAAPARRENELRYLAVRKHGDFVLVEVQDLLYIKGAGIYSELHLRNGRRELHDKSLEKLALLLPGTFERVHKSYLVPLAQVEKLLVQEGGKYQLQLKSGELIPVGRARYKELRGRLA